MVNFYDMEASHAIAGAVTRAARAPQDSLEADFLVCQQQIAATTLRLKVRATSSSPVLLFAGELGVSVGELVVHHSRLL